MLRHLHIITLLFMTFMIQISYAQKSHWSTQQKALIKRIFRAEPEQVVSVWSKALRIKNKTVIRKFLESVTFDSEFNKQSFRNVAFAFRPELCTQVRTNDPTCGSMTNVHPSISKRPDIVKALKVIIPKIAGLSSDGRNYGLGMIFFSILNAPHTNWYVGVLKLNNALHIVSK